MPNVSKGWHLLARDEAANTGWCLFDNVTIEFGHWLLPSKAQQALKHGFSYFILVLQVRGFI